MIKATDIYASVNKLLKSKYTGIKLPGNDIKEDFPKPSFFVDIRPKKISNDGINYKKRAYTIQITYFQKNVDEIDNMTKADEIEALFEYHLSVGDRKLPITDYGYEFVGENTNILQISIDIEYYDTVDRTDTHSIASGIILNEEKR